jgi:hypothetical protein
MITIINPVDFEYGYGSASVTPKSGYLLISPAGVLRGITDIQSYQQIRLKAETRKAYAEVALHLESMLRHNLEYQTKIDTTRKAIKALELDRDYAFAVDKEQLRTLKADLRAVLDSKVTLNQIARAIREENPTTKVSKSPQVWVKENSICITSTGILEEGYLPANKQEALINKYIERGRAKFEISVAGYPKHIGRMRICLEENVSELADRYIVYKHTLRFYYPCDLTFDDIKITKSALKLLGLTPTM